MGKMKRKMFPRKILCGMLSLVLAASCLPISAGARIASASAAIDAARFASPEITYRPGVRWWLPGGAITKEEMVREVDLLADNGFGYAEINPFGGGQSTAYTDTAPHDQYGTDEYYDAIEAAVAEASRRGLTIDLNMGSGWNANDKSVSIDESMGNLAIGRGAKVTISAEQVNTPQQITVPDMETSPAYGSGTLTAGGTKKLQALLIGRVSGTKADAITQGALDTNDKKDDQILLDAGNLKLIDFTASAEPAKAGDQIAWTPTAAGDYAVVALYNYPTGCRPIDSVSKTDAYVVDHMDKTAVEAYMENWMGANSRIHQIVEKYPGTVRAYFNDSYEFYGDTYYNEKLYENAKDADNNILGYDFSPYLVDVYKTYNAWPSYMAGRLASNDTFYAVSNADGSAKDADAEARIRYDYNQLVNQLFQEGMAGFSEKAAEYCGVYRQEAYNPPIDTIGSAKNVDIPESEQLNEDSLKRTTSGAHLYNRNLTTAEQYTLGCTPFKNTLETLKNGFDLMATSGVNNFFYHGFNYKYYGNETMKAESAYGENGYGRDDPVAVGKTARHDGQRISGCRARQVRRQGNRLGSGQRHSQWLQSVKIWARRLNLARTVRGNSEPLCGV